MLDHASVQFEAPETVLDVEAAWQMRAALDKPPSLPLSDVIRRASMDSPAGSSWLSDFWRALNGPGKLSAAEYFYYKLYDGRHSEDGITRFVGKTNQNKMHFACNDERWFAPSSDKLFFLASMRGNDVATPETLAVFDAKTGRSHPQLIKDIEGLIAFLDQPENYPMFAKPIDGMYSIGALALTDGGRGSAHVRGAGEVSTREIADYMFRVSDAGYLLQKTLNAAPDLASAFGGTLSSIRMLVCLGPGGARLESAVVKIPTMDNVADNYWRGGNMLGAIEADSGTITRIVTGTGPDIKCVVSHPDTGAMLLSRMLPHWADAKEMCLRAAGMLPGIRTQSWDIALTPDGPVALEVNWGGDLNLHQLAHGHGALTPSFCAHLREAGYKGKLPKFDN